MTSLFLAFACLWVLMHSGTANLGLVSPMPIVGSWFSSDMEGEDWVVQNGYDFPIMTLTTMM